VSRPDLRQVLSTLDAYANGPDTYCMVSADAAALLREAIKDAATLGKIIEAKDKLLVAYRVGGRPPESAFKVLDKYGPAELDALRARWRLGP